MLSSLRKLIIIRNKSLSLLENYVPKNEKRFLEKFNSASFYFRSKALKHKRASDAILRNILLQECNCANGDELEACKGLKYLAILNRNISIETIMLANSLFISQQNKTIWYHRELQWNIGKTLVEREDELREWVLQTYEVDAVGIPLSWVFNFIGVSKKL